MEKIFSRDNTKVKLLRSLKKAGKRKKENLFLIEGQKEISLAIAGGIEIKELFFCDDFGRENKFQFKLKTTLLSEEIFGALSGRENPDGFLALAVMDMKQLSEVTVDDNPVVLILEDVEKPGNIGAILRTADATKVDLIILCDAQTDIYNPNAIRSSLGTVFTVPVVAASNEETFRWLNKQKIPVYGTSLEASIDYKKPDYKMACAIVIGTEHEGISDFWLDNAGKNIMIPMMGSIDSLNASVSAGVILYEIVRQRGEKK